MGCALFAAIDFWRERYGRMRNGKYNPGQAFYEVLMKHEELSSHHSEHGNDWYDIYRDLSREDPDETDSISIFMRRFWKHFPKLEEREQRLLYMRYFLDMKCKDIGKELGLSESRVVQLIPYAEASLRARMLGRKVN